ncbi:hybrid sensor histidine kinase/response regulator [Desulfolutivibrio sulfoxidireducens]|uniref:hybrid sensor histidine kinase/response regulator n=1 Tax=Desulfolutivibrio sulfoxidireducens TaxID=2773299 RepID=UPI00159EB455|nr:ATP-binding protein [Desulfolutivibrio sulfoxidireducens]QLA14671.1 response regulator [Desulfolutivibrio sulfoxidireducens]QLA18252.1 response regulator [Desulfolutivibrio sulfoxidireducens]
MTWDFQHYAAQSQNALALFDAENRLINANAPFLDLLFGGESDGIGRALPVLKLPRPMRDGLESGLSEVRRAGGGHRFSWEEGAEVDHRRYQCQVLSGPGKDQAVVEVREESVAERLKQALTAERLVRRREEHLKKRGRRLFLNVIDELPVFVYMQRRDYTVAYANRKTRTYYGETEGRFCYEVFSGRDSPCPHCPTFRVFATGGPENWQFTDAEGRTFQIYDYPFEDENGEPLVMELGIDVTELKRVERELFQAHKMRAIGVLAGGIAHDLNNNLVPIVFNLDFVLNKTVDPVLADPLSEALRAAYRAADLVEQVMEYSRQQNVTLSPLRLIPLARESLDLLRATLPGNIALSVAYRAEKDSLLAHPAQIQQLLLNLCRNAVQAMPGGGTLTVDIGNLAVASTKKAPHPGLSPGDYAVVRVTDTGCGIEPDSLERIFEPFYTTKKNAGGTGMGLAVVHAIAASRGGVVHVDSAPGAGASFTVYLPLAAPAGEQIVAEPRPAGRGTGRLLLVDDDRGTLLAMSRVLRGAGFTVTAVESGEKGLQAYLDAKGGFDLILADQSMPGMCGMDMLGRILRHDHRAKAVICTGHVEPHLEAEAGRAGIAGFLVKPMSPRTLVDNIRRLLG